MAKFVSSSFLLQSVGSAVADLSTRPAIGAHHRVTPMIHLAVDLADDRGGALVETISANLSGRSVTLPYSADLRDASDAQALAFCFVVINGLHRRKGCSTVYSGGLAGTLKLFKRPPVRIGTGSHLQHETDGNLLLQLID